MTTTNKIRLQGFTLIEVMIVVVIIAIIAAVAFPSYQEQVRKGKRVQGKAKLVEVASKLERYYTDNGSYNTTLGPLYGLASSASIYAGDNNDAAGPYVISIAAPAGGSLATGYLLTATRNATFTDTKCGDLTLTNTGVKGKSGSGSVADCW